LSNLENKSQKTNKQTNKTNKTKKTTTYVGLSLAEAVGFSVAFALFDALDDDASFVFELPLEDLTSFVRLALLPPLLDFFPAVVAGFLLRLLLDDFSFPVVALDPDLDFDDDDEAPSFFRLLVPLVAGLASFGVPVLVAGLVAASWAFFAAASNGVSIGDPQE
jgi:hypothetical protein